MSDLWFRVLVLWYRLLGRTAVQADWQARRTLGRVEEAKGSVHARAQRAADARYTCVCGQLIVGQDPRCPQCGRRQWAPLWLRRLGRLLGVSTPSAGAGSAVVGVLMVAGYLVQLRYGEGDFFRPSKDALEFLELGASFGWLTAGVQPWRAITYTLLHGGLWHIGFNLLALAQVGPLVERFFGTGRFLFAWFVSGAIAALLPAWVGYRDMEPIIGASGAISGLIGMALVFGHRHGSTAGRMLRDSMIQWMVYTTIFGLVIGQVAHDAHFAGFGAGALLALIFPPAERRPGAMRLSVPLGAVGLGLVSASLVAAVLFLSSGARPPEGADGARATVWNVWRSDNRGLSAALDPVGIQYLESFDGKEASWKHAGRLREVVKALPEAQRWILIWALADKAPGSTWLALTVASLEAEKVLPDMSTLKAKD